MIRTTMASQVTLLTTTYTADMNANDIVKRAAPRNNRVKRKAVIATRWTPSCDHMRMKPLTMELYIFMVSQIMKSSNIPLCTKVAMPGDGAGPSVLLLVSLSVQLKPPGTV